MSKYFVRKIVLGLVAVSMLTAFKHTQNPDSIVVRNEAQSSHSLEDIENGSISPDLNGLWQYAMLAAAARDPEPDKVADKCTYSSKLTARWVRLSEYSQDSFFPNTPNNKIKAPGIGYSVWRDKSAVDITRVALVFRGTDPKELADWYSNFWAVTRINLFVWNQYQQARVLTPMLVKDFQNRFGSDVEIIAVGHSLGGGLAQHAAYSVPEISLVYTFASSPITGSTSRDLRNKSVNRKGMKIFRIYESGEILAALRKIGRRVLPLAQINPKITEIRFNFRSTFKRESKGGNPIGQHSVLQLSCDLICRVDKKLPHKTCRKSALKK